MKQSENLEDAILQKLSAYGDSLLEDVNSAKSSCKKARKRVREEEGSEPSGRSKKKKKKKNKSKELAEEKEKTPSKSDNSRYKGKHRHLEELKSRLALTDFESDLSKPDLDCTKLENNAQGSKNGRRQPEVIVFEDPAKRKQKRLAAAITPHARTVAAADSEAAGSEQESLVFDLKGARHSVKRLGISGLDKKSKEEAQIQLAMSLGAKAPKNPYLNYRELQEKKKKEQEDSANREKDEIVHSKTTSLADSMKQKNKTKSVEKKKKELSGVDGQIGSYKDGVLKLSKEDKRMFKKSR